MNSTQSIELFTAINIGIVGLSHFLQPKIWIDFFVFLYKHKNVGNVINALIALGMGSLIVSFHFIWDWPKVLITLYGVLQIIKAFVYLMVPSLGIASLAKVTVKTGYKFRWAGLLMFLMSLLILYGLWIEGVF